MFKRAVVTDEISQDFARAVAIGARYGLNGVELRSVWDKNPHELSNVELDKIKAIANDAGLVVPFIAAPVFKCQLDNDAEYREHVEILKKSIAVAEWLGAGLIRGFTFWDKGDFDLNFNQIIDKIGAIEYLLQDAQKVLVIEYDPATSANCSQRLEKIFAKLASNNIKALYDPGNNLWVKEAEKPFPDGYQRLKPYIAHIHVKDAIRDLKTGETEACCIGKGEVGFAELFQQLIKDGYEGWLSLETHYRVQGQLPENLLALPKGSAFSLGAEEASLECLDAWERLLK